MRFLSAALLSGLIALPAVASADSHMTAPATITVTGEGIVAAVPDLATVSLGVTMQGDTAAAAMAAGNTALQAVLERLKAAGIEDRDLQTSNLSLNPNWQSGDGTTATYQDIVEWKNDDLYEFRSQVRQPDGSWHIFMRSDYRRVK